MRKKITCYFQYLDDRQTRRDKERRVENRGDERIVQRSRSPYERDRREKERDRYREKEREKLRDKYDDRQRKRRDSPVQDGMLIVIFVHILSFAKDPIYLAR